MHVIKLDGYNATTENGEKLELGTFDSFGEEQLQIVKAPDWANLSVIATFNPPNRKPVQAVVDSVTGVIKVPKEATETPDAPEVDGAENTTDEENDTNEKESETNEG